MFSLLKYDKIELAKKNIGLYKIYKKMNKLYYKTNQRKYEK